MFPLTNDETITSIEVGQHSSFVLTSKAKVFTWGLNDRESSYLGVNQTTLFSTFSPQQMMFDNLLEGEMIIDVQFDISYHAFAVTNIGRILSWGHNYNQLVIDNGQDYNSKPELVLFN
jgi:alpha-tubulin suppressor-like RCC1 family protein